MKKSIWKRIGAGIMTAVMTAGMTVGMFAGTAIAADEKGSITVHSYSTTSAGTEANYTGEELTEVGGLGTPLAGAGFTLYNLTLPTLGADETLTGAYTVADATNTVTFTTSTGRNLAGTTGTAVGTLTTGSDGKITFGDLNPAHYLLVETTVPSGYNKTASSVISLPLTKKDGTGLNYNIHVYPKNVSQVPITKVVDDTTKLYNIGDDVAFTMNVGFSNTETEEANKVSSVADLKIGTAYGSMEITDALASTLTYKSAALSLLKADGTKVALVNNSDYTQTDNVKWTLTNAGIDKAVANNARGVEVKLVTTLGAGSTKITNKVEAKVRKANGGDPGIITPPEATVVPTATIAIENQDGANAATKLAGAKFKLATDAAGTAFVKDSAGNDIEVVTDANGKATFSGLTYNKTNGTKYYLIQTAATSGYQLKEAAITVDLEAGKTEDFTVNTIVKSYKNGTTDPENPKFALPLTGGNGTVLFTTIGLVMMIGAGAFYAKRKKASR